MTTTPNDTIRRSMIDALATRIIDLATDDDADFDLYDLIDDARNLITASAHHDLMLSLDICPMHETDIAICADDDNADCAHYRT